MFDTKKKGYRFVEIETARRFKKDIQNESLNPIVQIRKGLPEYKGQPDAGWMVYVKARSIAQEMDFDRLYKIVKESEVK